jgi:centractin
MSFEADVITNQPVVIDNGSGVLKAGFAGEDLPKSVFPSYVGRPKHVRVMAGAVEGNEFVGSKAEELRGLLRLKYPISHGIVEDWNDIELIWAHLYSKELNVNTEDHPVLLTEAPLNPRKNRERVSEIFFETFNVPALFVSLQAVLSLYASGRTTGVVLDSGDGVTHAVPIFEGFALPHAITRVEVAGREVTDYLQQLLRRSGHKFHTSSEWEVVRAVKERLCYVAFNPQHEEGLELKESSNISSSYKLPDGQTIQVGPERFRAPEVLFNPSIIGLEYCGIHDCLVNSILKADMDLRKTLFLHIVLSGGSTLFPGFGDRLLSEVRRKAPKDIKIRISAPPERKYSTWIGGSILASLAAFKKMWVSAEEWREEGALAIHRKTF